MYDRRITIIPQTPLLSLLISKYKLKPNSSDMMSLCRLTEGMMSLAEKMAYDIDNGITPNDIQMVISNSEIVINDQNFYNDIWRAIEGSVCILLTTIIMNDLANTIKYVTAIDDYKIIVETMRM